MPFDPQFVISAIYPAANAAYLITTVPDPALPAGYILVGAIEADTKQAALAMAQATPNQTHAVNEMLFESNIFGLVAWNAVDKTAIVAFRGTKTIWDWIDDIDAVQIPYSPVSGIGLVHTGFSLVYEHVRTNVAKLLTTGCVGVKRILVTGHSLGGAVADLSGLDIFKNIDSTFAPELYTLAGPRAGDSAFAAHFDEQIQVCYRIVNFMDVVPQVPLPPLYKHVGTEVLVHGGFKPLDITYAHQLSTYLAGLHFLSSSA